MNKPKKIILVFGTRPEAIKMAPLYHALKKDAVNFEILTCVTAQHREMLDQVLDVFDIKPDIDLNIMKSGQDLFDVTSAVLLGMRDVIKKNRPDLLLVHGDTTTTLGASLAAFYCGISIAHIEAGLRTYDVFSPFPEEMNRQFVSKLAKWHFAPTLLSSQNLLNEKVPADNITICGNTVIDAMYWVLDRLKNDPQKMLLIVDGLSQILKFKWLDSRYILITGHRRENFGQGFLEICCALRDLAKKYPQVHFIYPVHLNPNVQEPVNKILSGLKNIHLIMPLQYEYFLILLNHCYLVLTDSGGIQEEAPSLGKPVLVMRELTERPEAVLAGTVRLVGASESQIISAVSQLLDDDEIYQVMSCAHNPYGDGMACEKIIEVLRVV